MFLAVLVLLVAGQLVSGDHHSQQLALSSATLDFSQRLYQRMAIIESNIVYSPYSIHSALSMASQGARGVTATQMKDTLGVTSMGNSLHTTYRELIQQYSSETKVQLYTANALFINPRFTIVPEFIEDTQKNYFAKVDNIDMFSSGGPEKPINDYIANKTENMIKDMLGPKIVGSDTVMLLVNTIYFNGTWLSSFDKRLTRPQNFKQLDGTVKQVQMMRGEKRIYVKRDNANGVDVAQFTFKGERFCMYIILPQKVGNLAELESLLAEPDNVKDLLSGLSIHYVTVNIPKFKIEFHVNLKGQLIHMGIDDAFSPGKANFKGITSDDVYIDSVLHKAMIEVQETGTVAAAATVVEASNRSARQPSFSFIADHPFVFFLMDRKTGQILFQGKFSG